MSDLPDFPLYRDVEGKDGQQFGVQTYELSVGHGPDRDQWYETQIANGPGSGVKDRYATEKEARMGHDRICDALYNGEYELEPVSYILHLTDKDQ